MSADVTARIRRGRRLPEDPRQRWGTPRPLGLALCDEFGLTRDLAADEENYLLPSYLTREDDALSMRWGPRWKSWLNAPFGDLEPWIVKAYRAALRDDSTTVMLLPARVSSSTWWHRFSLTAEWWSFDGRVSYIPARGVKRSTVGFGSVLGVYGPGTAPGYAGVRCHLTGAVLERAPRIIRLAPPPIEVVPSLDGWQAAGEPIRFEVAGRPRAKGRPRATVRPMSPAAMAAIIDRGGYGALWSAIGKSITTYTPPETREAEQRVRGNARPFAPAEPLRGPVRLDLTYVFKLPQKRTARHYEGAPFTARPDLDNLTKLVKDALNGLFYEDDSQVVAAPDRKIYGLEAKTIVEVTPIDPAPGA